MSEQSVSDQSVSELTDHMDNIKGYNSDEKVIQRDIPNFISFVRDIAKEKEERDDMYFMHLPSYISMRFNEAGSNQEKYHKDMVRNRVAYIMMQVKDHELAFMNSGLSRREYYSRYQKLIFDR